MKAVLKYPGAKNRLAPWILEYVPVHKVYLEPFGGSLAVLFNKERCHIETVNDLDEDITNFFRILRDKSDELKSKISLTPYSRTEYEKAYAPCEDEVEKARRFAIKCWMGFGCGNMYQNGFKSGQQTNSPNPALAWSHLPEIMELATERLKGVQIENLPAVELIQRYNTSDVLFTQTHHILMRFENRIYISMRCQVQNMKCYYRCLTIIQERYFFPDTTMIYTTRCFMDGIKRKKSRERKVDAEE